MSRRNLAIEFPSVASLGPDQKNVRRHSGKQVQQTARIIDGLGFSVPVLPDANSCAMAGHGRLTACKQ